MAATVTARGERLTATAEPLVRGAVRSDDPRDLAFSARVNGRPVAAIADAEELFEEVSLGTQVFFGA